MNVINLILWVLIIVALMHFSGMSDKPEANNYYVNTHNYSMQDSKPTYVTAPQLTTVLTNDKGEGHSLFARTPSLQRGANARIGLQRGANTEASKMGDKTESKDDNKVKGLTQKLSQEGAKKK
jgi:hypothetical protein